MVISAPPVPPARPRRGHHVHDGFYLRLGAGLGYGRGSVSTDSSSAPNFDVSGAGLALNAWIGGTPWPGLAIGGLVALQGIRESNVVVEGDDTDRGMEVGTFMIGPFIDAFPDPQRGLHFGGALGLVGFAARADNHELEERLRLRNFEGGGLGLSAWIGYMGFVGPEWSLGGLLQLTGGVTGQDRYDVERRGSFGTLSLSLSALYH